MTLHKKDRLQASVDLPANADGKNIPAALSDIILFEHPVRNSLLNEKWDGVTSETLSLIHPAGRNWGLSARLGLASGQGTSSCQTVKCAIEIREGRTARNVRRDMCQGRELKIHLKSNREGEKYNTCCIIHVVLLHSLYLQSIHWSSSNVNKMEST